MVVYDRWFITPPVDSPDSTDPAVMPKYSDNSDVVGFAGNTFPNSVIQDGGYDGLLSQFPEYDEWYIARFYGVDNPGWNALNTIHNFQDTRTLTDHESDVAPIMNDWFGIDSWEFAISVDEGVV